MRKFILTLVSALMLGALSLVPVTQAAAATHVSIDIGVFYRDLAPYGHWVQRHNHGWVWVPRGMPLNWRPYTHGHWVFTDEYGWLWVSNWEWGWAAFHYGRWYFDDDYGWVWVPGRTWAPAWVTWRYGDDWIGWAPLPPAAVWYSGSGFRVSITSYERYIAPTSWVFVRERQFLHPHVRDYVVLGSRNVVILNHTRNVTRYQSVNGRIVNHGLDRNRYEQQTRQRVMPYRIQDVDRDTQRRAPAQGKVYVYQPRVQPAAPKVRPPAPAPAKPVPPARLNEEQARQMRELSRRQREDRYRVEERYRYEFQHPPQGATPQQLRQRQEEELRALRNEHQRQEQVLQKRQSRERSMDTRQRQPQQRQQPQQKQPQQQPRKKDQRDRNSR